MGFFPGMTYSLEVEAFLLLSLEYLALLSRSVDESIYCDCCIIMYLKLHVGLMGKWVN